MGEPWHSTQLGGHSRQSEAEAKGWISIYGQKAKHGSKGLQNTVRTPRTALTHSAVSQSSLSQRHIAKYEEGLWQTNIDQTPKV
jgi:hypothetical protein